MSDRLTIKDLQPFIDGTQTNCIFTSGDYATKVLATQLLDTMRENERLRGWCTRAKISLDNYPAEKNSGVQVAIESLDEALSNKDSLTTTPEMGQAYADTIDKTNAILAAYKDSDHA